MPYTVQFAPPVAKDVESLPRETLERIRRKTAALADEPRPRGCEKLAGADDLYRVRVGDYRAVYQVRDADHAVLVLRIGHRREVYRRR